MGKLKTTEDFIREAKLINGDRYDYTLVDYIGIKKKVKIICKIHGVFLQAPSDHLSNRQCFECSKKIKIRQKEKIHLNL